MTLDLAIMREQKPRTVVAYADPPLAQDGSAKLATRFVSIFFSDYNAGRDRGTSFMAKYRTGRILTTARLRREFAIAASEVIRQLGDQAALPDDETLVSARLEEAEISTNYDAYLRVRLFTRNGSVTIEIPVERV